jgi:hypothetical protein
LLKMDGNSSQQPNTAPPLPLEIFRLEKSPSNAGFELPSVFLSDGKVSSTASLKDRSEVVGDVSLTGLGKHSTVAALRVGNDDRLTATAKEQYDIEISVNKAIKSQIDKLASASYKDREVASKQLAAFREAVPLMIEKLTEIRNGARKDLEQERRLERALLSHGIPRDLSIRTDFTDPATGQVFASVSLKDNKIVNVKYGEYEWQIVKDGIVESKNGRISDTYVGTNAVLTFDEWGDLKVRVGGKTQHNIGLSRLRDHTEFQNYISKRRK